MLKLSHVVISPTSSAVKAGGQAGEPVKVMLDIWPDSPEQITEILSLRGRELVVVLVPIERAGELELK